MEGEKPFRAMSPTLETAFLDTTLSVKNLVAEDLAFHRSYDQKLGREIDTQNRRLLRIAERIIENAITDASVVGPKLRDLEAVDVHWKDIVDVIDSLLERIDTTLDEFAGVLKRASTPMAEGASTPRSQHLNVFKRNDISKPQKFFEPVPNYDDTGPFKPLLTTKPHAITPLEKCLVPTTDENGVACYTHPYKTEIEQYQYGDSIFTESEPIPYLPFESTTATFVDTEEAVAEMLGELKMATEIAIDLEHHDVRTYAGLTCLMQISTRNKDWIVDTLKPWRRRLECLNEVFANPNILKVFHGAHSDMIWLQRDFGLYVVGYFDTYHAARALRYPGGSLAFLLQKFINFDAQKKYQMADWRIRPVPHTMLEYARSDTHFLLYIYDCMKNELLQKAVKTGEDLIQQVLDNSNAYALQRYENPTYDVKLGLGVGGWYRQLSKTPALLSKEQFSVFRAVHHWRDVVARKEDESIQFVLQNHSLFELARLMPTDKATLHSILPKPSNPVRQRMDELISLIVRAKEAGANGPAMATVLAEADAVYSQHRAGRKAANAVDAPLPSSQITGMDEAQTPEKPLITKVKVDRLQESVLFGKAWPRVEPQCPPPRPDLRLVFPLPELQEQAFLEGNFGGGILDVKGSNDGVSPQVNSQPSTPALPQPQFKEGLQPSSGVGNGLFVLRELGGARKRKAADANLEDEAQTPRHDEADTGPATTTSTNANSPSLISSLETAEEPVGGNGVENTLGSQDMEPKKDRGASKRANRLSRSQRKAEKAAKQAAMQAESWPDQQQIESARQQQSSGGNATFGNGPTAATKQPVQPFSYETAPSVLHAIEQSAVERGKKNKKPQGMDPYAQALNAPKGLARAQKPKAGKSGTWAPGA